MKSRLIFVFIFFIMFSVPCIAEDKAEEFILPHLDPSFKDKPFVLHRKTKQEIQVELEKISAKEKDDIKRRVLVEDPVKLAEESIKVRDFKPLGISGGYSGSVSIEGIDCPVEVKARVYNGGCFFDEVYYAIETRYTAYNRALVQSSEYKGVCKLAEE